MYMVGHKNPSMYVDVKLLGSLGQPVRVSSDIRIGREADLTVDTTLYHMDGKPSWTESASSRHLKLDRCKVSSQDVNCPDERSLEELDGNRVRLSP